MIPPPRENPRLLGHQAAEAEMLAAMRGGRMHHAWLITGPQGVGKATLAYRFARRLLAGVPGSGDDLALDPGDKVFRRVAAGSHADLLTVERSFDEARKKLRGEIVIDDVRQLGGFLRLTPAEGGWRVVVIDGAEDLNRNAANAVLKLLEEPPPRAILLLTCAASGRLLPTIRSRCRRLALGPVSEPDLRALLAEALPDMPPPERDRLGTLAAGSPGRALLLAEARGLSLAGLAEEALRGPVRLSRTLAIADAINGRGAEDGFSTFMTLLRDGLAAQVRGRARGPDSVPALAARAELWHALGQIQDETERLNLDKRQAVIASLTLLSGP